MKAAEHAATRVGQGLEWTVSVTSQHPFEQADHDQPYSLCGLPAVRFCTRRPWQL
jgi:hypothetical protein